MKFKSSKTYKLIIFLLCFLLAFEQSGFAAVAGEMDISGRFNSLQANLFQESFRPLHLRYLSYDNLNNDFKVLLDKGSLNIPSDKELKNSSQELLNYFFIGLSLPNDSFWVNLRPDSPDNVIDPLLAQTDIGRVMLEADVQLKKDTARLTSPETLEGKEYWTKLYQKAGEIYGSQNITIPTLTRPWIVPNEIIIRETTDNAYIYKATLKVMLEEDYLKGSSTYNFTDERAKALNSYSSELIRQLILPRLTKEINSSKRYAPLRQVYYSLILAQWFKQRHQGQSFTNQYLNLIDSKDLTNLVSKTDWSTQTYFNQYQKSFKDGEYNIKAPIYTPYGQVIRSYFSGGIVPVINLPLLGQTIVDPSTGASATSILPGNKRSSSPIVGDAGIKVYGDGRIETVNRSAPWLVGAEKVQLKIPPGLPKKATAETTPIVGDVGIKVDENGENGNIEKTDNKTASLPIFALRGLKAEIQEQPNQSGRGTVTLSWDNATEANHYEIYLGETLKSTTSRNFWIKGHSFFSSSNSNNNRGYKFKIVAVNAEGKKSQPAFITIYVDPSGKMTTDVTKTRMYDEIYNAALEWLDKKDALATDAVEIAPTFSVFKTLIDIGKKYGVDPKDVKLSDIFDGDTLLDIVIRSGIDLKKLRQSDNLSVAEKDKIGDSFIFDSGDTILKSLIMILGRHNVDSLKDITWESLNGSAVIVYDEPDKPAPAPVIPNIKIGRLTSAFKNLSVGVFLFMQTIMPSFGGQAPAAVFNTPQHVVMQQRAVEETPAEETPAFNLVPVVPVAQTGRYFSLSSVQFLIMQAMIEVTTPVDEKQITRDSLRAVARGLKYVRPQSFNPSLPTTPIDPNAPSIKRSAQGLSKDDVKLNPGIELPPSPPRNDGGSITIPGVLDLERRPDAADGAVKLNGPNSEDEIVMTSGNMIDGLRWRYPLRQLASLYNLTDAEDIFPGWAGDQQRITKQIKEKAISLNNFPDQPLITGNGRETPMDAFLKKHPEFKSQPNRYKEFWKRTIWKLETGSGIQELNAREAFVYLSYYNQEHYVPDLCPDDAVDLRNKVEIAKRLHRGRRINSKYEIQAIINIDLTKTPAPTKAKPLSSPRSDAGSKAGEDFFHPKGYFNPIYDMVASEVMGALPLNAVPAGLEDVPRMQMNIITEGGANLVPFLINSEEITPGQMGGINSGIDKTVSEADSHMRKQGKKSWSNRNEFRRAVLFEGLYRIDKGGLDNGDRANSKQVYFLLWYHKSKDNRILSRGGAPKIPDYFKPYDEQEADALRDKARKAAASNLAVNSLADIERIVPEAGTRVNIGEPSQGPGVQLVSPGVDLNAQRQDSLELNKVEAAIQKVEDAVSRKNVDEATKYYQQAFKLHNDLYEGHEFQNSILSRAVGLTTRLNNLTDIINQLAKEEFASSLNQANADIDSIKSLQDPNLRRYLNDSRQEVKEYAQEKQRDLTALDKIKVGVDEAERLYKQKKYTKAADSFNKAIGLWDNLNTGVTLGDSTKTPPTKVYMTSSSKKMVGDPLLTRIDALGSAIETNLEDAQAVKAKATADNNADKRVTYEKNNKLANGEKEEDITSKLGKAKTVGDVDDQIERINDGINGIVGAQEGISDPENPKVTYPVIAGEPARRLRLLELAYVTKAGIITNNELAGIKNNQSYTNDPQARLDALNAIADNILAAIPNEILDKIPALAQAIKNKVGGLTASQIYEAKDELKLADVSSNNTSVTIKIKVKPGVTYKVIFDGNNVTVPQNGVVVRDSLTPDTPYSYAITASRPGSVDITNTGAVMTQNSRFSGHRPPPSSGVSDNYAAYRQVAKQKTNNLLGKIRRNLSYKNNPQACLDALNAVADSVLAEMPKEDPHLSQIIIGEVEALVAPEINKAKKAMGLAINAPKPAVKVVKPAKPATAPGVKANSNGTFTVTVASGAQCNIYANGTKIGASSTGSYTTPAYSAGTTVKFTYAFENTAGEGEQSAPVEGKIPPPALAAPVVDRQAQAEKTRADSLIVKINAATKSGDITDALLNDLNPQVGAAAKIKKGQLISQERAALAATAQNEEATRVRNLTSAAKDTAALDAIVISGAVTDAKVRKELTDGIKAKRDVINKQLADATTEFYNSITDENITAADSALAKLKSLGADVTQLEPKLTALKQKLAAPTYLAAQATTSADSAAFSWKGVADEYILKVDTTEYRVKGTSYKLLLPVGEYSWSVKAVGKGENNFGAIAEGVKVIVKSPGVATTTTPAPAPESTEVNTFINIALDKNKGVSARLDAMYKFDNFKEDPGVFSALIKLSKDPSSDINIRILAIFDLGDLGYSRAIDSLIEFLNDSNYDLRFEAARALGNLGDERAREPLNNRLAVETNEFVIHEIKQVLDKLPTPALAVLVADTTPPSAVSNLVAKAEGDSVKLNWDKNTESDFDHYLVAIDTNNPVTTRDISYTFNSLTSGKHNITVIAVDNAGNKSSVSALEITIEQPAPAPVAATSSPELTKVDSLKSVLLDKNIDIIERVNAAKALGYLGDLRAVLPLIAALNDSDFWLRGDAAEALGYLGDLRAVLPLIAALNDSDSFVRVKVSWSLGQLGDKKAREPLQNLLNTETDSDVKKAIQEALAKLPAPALAVPVADTTPPSAVSNLVAKAEGDSVKLNWDKNTESDFDHYLVTVDNNAPVSTNKDNAHTVKSLTPGGHEIKVVAVDNLGNKSSVSITNVTIAAEPAPVATAPAPKPVPVAPSGLSYVIADNKVTFKWDVASGAKSYILNFNGSDSAVTDTAITVALPLSAGTYSWTITAVGEGANNNSAAVKGGDVEVKPVVATPVPAPVVVTALPVVQDAANQEFQDKLGGKIVSRNGANEGDAFISSGTQIKDYLVPRLESFITDALKTTPKDLVAKLNEIDPITRVNKTNSITGKKYNIDMSSFDWNEVKQDSEITWQLEAVIIGIQNALGISEDGDYGPKTIAAMIQKERDLGITAGGASGSVGISDSGALSQGDEGITTNAADSQNKQADQVSAAKRAQDNGAAQQQVQAAQDSIKKVAFATASPSDSIQASVPADSTRLSAAGLDTQAVVPAIRDTIPLQLEEATVDSLKTDTTLPQPKPRSFWSRLFGSNVEEIDFEDLSAQVIRKFNTWKNLQDLKDEYTAVRKGLAEGKTTKKTLALNEINIATRLIRILIEHINTNKDNYKVSGGLDGTGLNCLGFTQWFYILGKEIGLNVIPVEAVGMPAGFSRLSDDGHITSLVYLSDGTKIFVDPALVTQDSDIGTKICFVSKPFELESAYSREGALWKTNDHSLYTEFSFLSRDGLVSAVYINMGVNYEQKGEYPQAVEAFQQAVSLNPTNPIASFNLGEMYLSPRYADNQKAKECFERVVTFAPTDAKAWNALGDANYNLGNFDNARADYNQAVSLGNKIGYYGLGNAYYKLKDFQEARDNLQQYLNSAPGDTLKADQAKKIIKAINDSLSSPRSDAGGRTGNGKVELAGWTSASTGASFSSAQSLVMLAEMSGANPAPATPVDEKQITRDSLRAVARGLKYVRPQSFNPSLPTDLIDPNAPSIKRSAQGLNTDHGGPVSTGEPLSLPKSSPGDSMLKSGLDRDPNLNKAPNPVAQEYNSKAGGHFEINLTYIIDNLSKSPVSVLQYFAAQDKNSTNYVKERVEFGKLLQKLLAYPRTLPPGSGKNAQTPMQRFLAIYPEFKNLSAGSQDKEFFDRAIWPFKTEAGAVEALNSEEAYLYLCYNGQYYDNPLTTLLSPSDKQAAQDLRLKAAVAKERWGSLPAKYNIDFAMNQDLKDPRIAKYVAQARQKIAKEDKDHSLSSPRSDAGDKAADDEVASRMARNFMLFGIIGALGVKGKKPGNGRVAEKILEQTTAAGPDPDLVNSIIPELKRLLEEGILETEAAPGEIAGVIARESGMEASQEDLFKKVIQQGTLLGGSNIPSNREKMDDYIRQLLMTGYNSLWGNPDIIVGLKTQAAGLKLNPQERQYVENVLASINMLSAGGVNLAPAQQVVSDAQGWQQPVLTGGKQQAGGNDLSGIDFRSMPIVTQPMVLPGSNLRAPFPGNAILAGIDDTELQEIKKLIAAGMIPSTARIKEYIAGRLNNQQEAEQDINKVLSCFASIFKLEEEQAIATEPEVKQILALLESDKTPAQMKLALSRIDVSSNDSALFED